MTAAPQDASSKTLIEKLEAEAFNPTGDDRMGRFVPLDKAIAMVRDHAAVQDDVVERLKEANKDLKAERHRILEHFRLFSRELQSMGLRVGASIWANDPAYIAAMNMGEPAKASSVAVDEVILPPNHPIERVPQHGTLEALVCCELFSHELDSPTTCYNNGVRAALYHVQKWYDNSAKANSVMGEPLEISGGGHSPATEHQVMSDSPEVEARVAPGAEGSIPSSDNHQPDKYVDRTSELDDGTRAVQSIYPPHSDSTARKIANAVLATTKRVSTQPDDCREAFEKYESTRLGTEDFSLDEDGDYEDMFLSSRWRDWQAAWNARCPEREASCLPTEGAQNCVDYLQRKGAPLSFYASIAAHAYAAACTRDDVSHHDAMKAALDMVEKAITEGNSNDIEDETKP